MKKLNGIFPALITPMNIDGSVNYEMSGKLISNLQERGVAGFYVGGSTAESYLLSMDERKKVLKN